MFIAIALLAEAAFKYTVQADMMIVAKTHIARMGSARGPSIVIACGAATDNEMMVNIKPGTPLDDFKGGILMPFKNRVRFGDAIPVDMEVEYLRDTIVFTGRDAIAFAKAAKASDQVVIEFKDYRDTVRQMRLPLTGAAESISQVESGCGIIAKK